MKYSYVYIMASNNETLYVWVTSDLIKRVYEHKNWVCEWFTKKYFCNKVVYFELFEDINEAIKKEKQIKKWKREYKINLINSKNVMWNDLYNEVL